MLGSSGTTTSPRRTIWEFTTDSLFMRNVQFVAASIVVLGDEAGRDLRTGTNAPVCAHASETPATKARDSIVIRMCDANFMFKPKLAETRTDEGSRYFA